MLPWFKNTFVCKQFGWQTEAFIKILFVFANCVSSDKHNFQNHKTNQGCKPKNTTVPGVLFMKNRDIFTK